MNKSLIRFLILPLMLGVIQTGAFADFRQHFDMGQSYLTQYRYSDAISEFKSALKINYMDTSARVGLINSFLARGTDYANKSGEYEKAADDFRAALFYLKYYPSAQAAQNSAHAITQVTSNLEQCLDNIHYDKSFKNRFATAKRLRAEGNFAAAGYEFQQSLGDKSLQKDSFEQIGSIMKVLGNNAKAEEYYKKAVAIDPSDINLRLTYAKVLGVNKNVNEENKQYSYILSHVSDQDKETLYILERTFTKKLDAEPTNANLTANLGAIYQKEGKFDEALNYYMKAESLDPSSLSTRINIGTLYQQKGDYRTAIKMYESVLILEPNNVNANFYRAQCYDKIGETRTAQEGYKKVLAIDPNNSMVRAQMIENVKKEMSPQQFVAYVNTTFPNGDPSRIIYDYAIELHKNNKLEDAFYLYNEAIKSSNGQNYEMYVNLALAQAQNKDYDGAILTLQKAKSNFPTNETIDSTIKDISDMKFDTQMAKASEFYKSQNYKEAITTYLSINPPTADTMLGAATSYQELGDTNSAIEYYKKALDLKPLDSDIAYYIAVLYGENEDYENAKIYLGKSIAFNKNNKNASDYLAQIEEADRANLLNNAIAKYEENKLEDSLTDFNKLLTKEPKNAYALYYRGMIYDTTGKRYEAIKDLKQAYELNKDFSICNYLIASNYDSLEKYKDAYTYYTSYANSDVPDDEYKQYAKARAEELKEYAKK